MDDMPLRPGEGYVMGVAAAQVDRDGLERGIREIAERYQDAFAEAPELVLVAVPQGAGHRFADWFLDRSGATAEQGLTPFHPRKP